MNLGKLIFGSRRTGHDTQNKLVRTYVMTRDKFTCQLCKRIYNKKMAQRRPWFFFDYAHIDHIIPFSLGGRNHVDNYQLLCSVCNLAKGNTVPDEYL